MPTWDRPEKSREQTVELSGGAFSPGLVYYFRSIPARAGILTERIGGMDMRILIAEDEVSIGRALKVLLEKE